MVFFVPFEVAASTLKPAEVAKIITANNALKNLKHFSFSYYKSPYFERLNLPITVFPSCKYIFISLIL